MRSLRNDSTPTNYNIKLESDGFNIEDINHVLAGDTITFLNTNSEPVTLTFRPGLQGLSSATLEANGEWQVLAREGDGDYEIDFGRPVQGPLDVIKLSIKMGGRTEK